jgi:hypothetical protein
MKALAEMAGVAVEPLRTHKEPPKAAPATSKHQAREPLPEIDEAPLAPVSVPDVRVSNSRDAQIRESLDFLRDLRSRGRQTLPVREAAVHLKVSVRHVWRLMANASIRKGITNSQPLVEDLIRRLEQNLRETRSKLD